MPESRKSKPRMPSSWALAFLRTQKWCDFSLCMPVSTVPPVLSHICKTYSEGTPTAAPSHYPYQVPAHPTSSENKGQSVSEAQKCFVKVRKGASS